VNTAKVVVTLEIHNTGGHWDDECSIGQIKKQAKDSAVQEIRRMIQEQAKIYLVGEPRVTVILIDDEEG